MPAAFARTVTVAPVRGCAANSRRSRIAFVTDLFVKSVWLECLAHATPRLMESALERSWSMASLPGAFG